MERRNEAIGSVGGMIAGAVTGAVKGSHIGLAVGGPGGAIVGTIPCAIVGGIIGLLGGNKIGSEIDRRWYVSITLGVRGFLLYEVKFVYPERVWKTVLSFVWYTSDKKHFSDTLYLINIYLSHHKVRRDTKRFDSLSGYNSLSLNFFSHSSPMSALRYSRGFSLRAQHKKIQS